MIRFRTAAIGICALALISTACVKKVATKLAFKAFSTKNFTVDFEVPINEFGPISLDSVATPGQPINLDSIVRAETNGVFTVDDVTAVYVDKLNIELTNADAANNLQNFEGVRLTLKSVDESVAPVEICNATIADTYADKLELPIFDDRNLKPVVVSRGIIYLAGVSTRRNTSKVLNGKLTFSFDVR